MKSIQFIGLLIGLLSPFIFVGCENEKAMEEKPATVKHNYITLLDLSDRILDADQVRRDKEILLSIYEAFLHRQKTQFYFPSVDEFKVVLAYQKNAVPASEIYNIENELYINVAKLPISKKKDLRDSAPQIESTLTSLYELAVFSDQAKDYHGADIQGYLRDRLASDIPQDVDAETFLIILTDGYQYVEGRSKPLSDWPSVTDLSNVNVLVLEMAPKLNKPQEQDKMLTTWTNWLKSMNAKKVTLVPQNALAKEKDILHDFLSSTPIRASTKEVPIKKVAEQSLPPSSGQLPAGDYAFLKDGMARTLRLETDYARENGNFECSILQLGSEYQSLKGKYDDENNSLTIEKLGTFDISVNEEYVKIISNSQSMVYSMRIK